jgi:hypothetical protein
MCRSPALVTLVSFAFGVAAAHVATSARADEAAAPASPAAVTAPSATPAAPSAVPAEAAPGAPPATPAPFATPAPPASPPPPAVQPQAGDTEQPARLRRRTGSGPPPKSKRALYGGLGLLAGSYVVTALAGVGMLTGPPPSEGSSGRLIACMNCQSSGPRMLVPIAGPWIALPDVTGGGRFLLELLGTAQVVAIIGILEASSNAPPAEEPDPGLRQRQRRANGQLSFGLLPTQDGAFGFVSARF